MIIGITGRIGAGKGYLANYFEENGFTHLTISKFIKDELIKRGLPLTRENYQDVGDEVRKKEGNGAWIVRMKIGEGHYVVDGIRNPGEIRELKKRKDFFLISIDANQRIRYERVLARGKAGDRLSWEEFVENDDREMSEKDESKMQLKACMDMADYKIVNNNGVQEFEESVNKIYQKIREKMK